MPRGRRRPPEDVADQAQAKAAKRRSSTRSRTKSMSPDEIKSLVDSLTQRVYEMLGLDMIGLRPDDIRDLLTDVITGMAEGRSTKLTEEAAMKRIAAARDNLLKAVASKLLADGKVDSRERLQFVVAYLPEAAGRAAPALYRIALKLGAQDVIDALRSLWSQYGRPTPIACPRCGFLAVTPDLTCMVCGAALSESEVKRSLGFPKVLESLASRLHPRLIEEILAAGYVVVDGDVEPPSMAPQGFRVVLHLNRDEKELLRRVLLQRQAQQGQGA